MRKRSVNCIYLMLALTSNFFITVQRSAAQINLVPNFSFEQYDTCPNAQDQIQYATGWSKYSNSLSTPDYYNACAPGGYYNVPNSGNGYQLENRMCNAYAGIITIASTPNYREYIGIPLSQPLIIGQKYYISFDAVFCEVHLGANYYGMPSNNIGIRLSTVPFSESSPCPIGNYAHLNMAAILSDSVSWTHIAGSIVADSAYAYVIAGNFFDDAVTDTLHFSCGTCFNLESYYYVDDICVSTDSLLCNGGLNLLPCNVGVQEPTVILSGGVYPNPFVSFVSINFWRTSDYRIQIFDAMGRQILASTYRGRHYINLELASFSMGVYYLRLSDIINGQTKISKIIKL